MRAPTATEAPIAIDRLVKRYKAVTAVDGISFSIAAGSCAALLGGNGAGKTTTISTIMGLVEPTAGTVTVLGATMPRQRHRVLHRMNFESPYVNMPMRLTVRQNLNVFGMLYGCADVAGRIRALADEFDMHGFLDRETGKLSSGQKTRVALAKSLINEPEKFCCSMSRRPRSIPTPPIGCAGGWSAIAASAAPPCCLLRTT